VDAQKSMLAITALVAMLLLNSINNFNACYMTRPAKTGQVGKIA